MSFYTTPLQFGYFLALAMSILFWVRGYKEERLSDGLLGWVMFFLAMEIQDYTFGFSGINYLWEDLNGFPRGTALLFGPAVYFYLKSQTNRDFKFQRKHLLHLVPWLILTVPNLIIFLNGKYAVQAWQSSDLNWYLGYPLTALHWASYIFYFTKSLQLYKSYRAWSKDQFSDQDIISFTWFRNMVYAMIAGILFKEISHLFSFFLDLDYNQDWYWNLGIVVIIFYVGIWGYSQVQPSGMDFSKNKKPEPSLEKDPELTAWRPKIEALMEEQKAYLEPQLSLKTMAQKLRTNPGVLSAAINQNFGKNFNDFVNEFRVNEFLEKSKQPEFKHYTLLALALDSGFNSKSTFNRSFKKITGKAPTEIESR